MENTSRNPLHPGDETTPDKPEATAAAREATEKRDSRQFGADVASGQFDEQAGSQQLSAEPERPSTKTGGRIEPKKAPDEDHGKAPAPEDPVGERRDAPRRAPPGRQPYPVDDPGIADPDRPGSQPDYIPGRPIGNPPSI